MKTRILMTLLLAIALSTTAFADISNFYAVTNEIGYTGSVTNVTQGTTAVEFSTPRNAYLYLTKGVFSTDYNIIMSNWSEHSTSNQNDSFFQLYDDDGSTITSESAGWLDDSTFAFSVTGENAAYEQDWSRLWQPDNNHAKGGIYTSYSYSLVASGMDSGIADTYLQNTTDPTSITGHFEGEFQAYLYDANKNVIGIGDTYFVSIDFDQAAWDSNNFNGEIDNSFGIQVPAPSAIMLGLIGTTFAGLIRRKRN